MRLLILALIASSAARAQDSVQVFWSGALAPHSITVKARMSAALDSVRLAYCPAPCWSGPVYSAYTTTDSISDFVATFTLDGLLPDREYQYRFEVGGMIDAATERLGRFRTPADAPADFSFVFGSCNGMGTHPVWQAMRERDPLFFLSTGDLHYRDPNSAQVDAHRDPYREDILSFSPMKDLLHEVPIAYMWDDHDFCGNGSDASFLGKTSAAQAYREYVPHYPLHDAIGIHQSFTIGRVHFILSDLRSSKTAESMMSNAQFAWLLGEFLYARDNGLVAAWVTPLTWNSMDYPENWGCQPAERTGLNDLLFGLGVKDAFILAGDAHMLAIDDGTHADFSTQQELQYYYPIFQAAAIARFGSYKGGVFNQGGWHANPDMAHGQFGEVIVADNGEEVCITFNGWRTDGVGSAVSLVNTYTFCRTPGALLVSVDQPTTTDLPFLWHMPGEGLVIERAAAHEPLLVQVVDARGAVLLQEWHRGQGLRTTVPLPSLPAGIYTAVVQQGSVRGVHRFVAN
jgi:PhoD-like phosphatase